MVKILCDHCGIEICTCLNELDEHDTFYDIDKRQYVGKDKILCDDCYNLREDLHMKLDREFLHMEDET